MTGLIECSLPIQLQLVESLTGVAITDVHYVQLITSKRNVNKTSGDKMRTKPKDARQTNILPIKNVECQVENEKYQRCKEQSISELAEVRRSCQGIGKKKSLAQLREKNQNHCQRLYTPSSKLGLRVNIHIIDFYDSGTQRQEIEAIPKIKEENLRLVDKIELKNSVPTTTCAIRSTRKYQTVNQPNDEALVDLRTSERRDEISDIKRAKDCIRINSVEKIIVNGVDKTGQNKTVKQKMRSFVETVDICPRSMESCCKISRRKPEDAKQNNNLPIKNVECDEKYKRCKERPISKHAGVRSSYQGLEKKKRLENRPDFNLETNSAYAPSLKSDTIVKIHTRDTETPKGMSCDDSKALIEPKRYQRLYALSKSRRSAGKKRREDIALARIRAKEIPAQPHITISLTKAVEISNRMYDQAMTDHVALKRSNLHAQSESNRTYYTHHYQSQVRV